MLTVDPILEDLINQIGPFGYYQIKQHALHLMCAFLAGMNMLSLTFVAPTPRHRCFIEELDRNMTHFTHNLQFDSTFLKPYIPLNENGDIKECQKYEIPFDYTSVVSCNEKFVYDKSTYKDSRVYEFGMVCEKKWQRAFIQSIYVFGVLNGALICGWGSDRFGRKNILYLSAILQFVFSFAGAYISNYAVYCVSLFFYGFFGSGGAFITAFVLSIELMSKRKRAYCSSAFAGSFATGVCFVAVWGYVIRDVTLLQTTFALHALLLFGHYWLLDESIRWVWSQGRVQDAIRIVRKACHQNGLPFNNVYTELITTSVVKSEGVHLRKYGLSDLFKTPVIRFRAMNAAFLWFSIALCYYGLAFNTGVLPGDPYFVFFLAGFVDLPGHFFVALTVNKTGRRSLNAVLLFIGGLACVITTLIPKGLAVTTVIAMVAKAALAGCFAVMYNYTAELFPTVVRNSAVGLCSMAARFGGTLTPQISLLDSFDRRFPTLVFGGVAMFASMLALLLPETLNKDLPQSLEDGENFRTGDTAFSDCLPKRASDRERNETESEQRQRLREGP